MRSSTTSSSGSGSGGGSGVISGSSSSANNLSSRGGPGTSSSPFPIFGNAYIVGSNYNASNPIYNSSAPTATNGQVGTPKNYLLMDNIHRRYSYGSTSRRNSNSSIRSDSDQEGLEDNVMFLHRMLIQNNGQARQAAAAAAPAGSRQSNRASFQTLPQTQPKGKAYQSANKHAKDESQRKVEQEQQEERVVRGTCRICFEEDNVEEFVSPCKCKGTWLMSMSFLILSSCAVT